MRKFLKVLLIIFGVILLLYAIYYIAGRPAVPLPVFRYSVSQGSPLYDIVKATESGKVTLVVVTNGEIKAKSNGNDLATITYTSESLNNTIQLASKFAVPAETQYKMERISKFFPPIRKLPKVIQDFFIYVIRFRLTVEIAAV